MYRGISLKTILSMPSNAKLGIDYDGNLVQRGTRDNFCITRAIDCWWRSDSTKQEYRALRTAFIDKMQRKFGPHIFAPFQDKLNNPDFEKYGSPLTVFRAKKAYAECSKILKKREYLIEEWIEDQSQEIMRDEIYIQIRRHSRSPYYGFITTQLSEENIRELITKVKNTLNSQAKQIAKKLPDGSYSKIDEKLRGLTRTTINQTLKEQVTAISTGYGKLISTGIKPEDLDRIQHTAFFQALVDAVPPNHSSEEALRKTMSDEASKITAVFCAVREFTSLIASDKDWENHILALILSDRDFIENYHSLNAEEQPIFIETYVRKIAYFLLYLQLNGAPMGQEDHPKISALVKHAIQASKTNPHKHSLIEWIDYTVNIYHFFNYIKLFGSDINLSRFNQLAEQLFYTPKFRRYSNHHFSDNRWDAAFIEFIEDRFGSNAADSILSRMIQTSHLRNVSALHFDSAFESLRFARESCRKDFLDRQYALSRTPQKKSEAVFSDELVTLRKAITKEAFLVASEIYFKLGMDGLGRLEDELQCFLDKPADDSKQPFQDPFASIVDPEDPRLTACKKDLHRTTGLNQFLGEELPICPEQSLETIEAQLQIHYSNYPQCANNAFRDLSQLMCQRTLATITGLNDGLFVGHKYKGNRYASRPWQGHLLDHVPFTVESDPDDSDSLLITYKGMLYSHHKIFANGEANFAVPHEDSKSKQPITDLSDILYSDYATSPDKVAKEGLTFIFRYTPSRTPNFPGVVRTLYASLWLKIEDNDLTQNDF